VSHKLGVKQVVNAPPSASLDDMPATMQLMDAAYAAGWKR